MNNDNQLRNDYTSGANSAPAKRKFYSGSSQNLQDLHSDKANLLIGETDPNHAYGPNYYMLPRTLKLYYKYMRMRKFVHVQIEDEKEIINFNYLFYGTTAAATFGTYGFFKILSSMLSKSGNPNVSSLGRACLKAPVFAFGVPASIAGSLAYGYLNVYFVKNYVVNFLDKYRKEAIDNGFDDYQLSEDKGGESWTNIYHVFKM